MTQFTEEQVERIAQKAATKAVEDLLTKLGVDVTDVRETQRDFAHLRNQRQASEQVSVWTRRIVLGFIITSTCTLLLTGIKAALAGLLHQS